MTDLDYTPPPRSRRIIRGVSRAMATVRRVVTQRLSELGAWLDRVTAGGFRRVAIVGAGIDEQTLIKEESPEELNKFLAIGAIVCVTAGWAFIGANFFFDQLLYPAVFTVEQVTLTWHERTLRHVPVLILAALWGIMIFQIDRVFLSTMLGQLGWRRIAMASVRLTLAVLLGYFVSHPLKMRFFEDEIQGYRQLKVDYAVQALRETREAEYQLAQGDLQQATEAWTSKRSEDAKATRLVELEQIEESLLLLRNAEREGFRFIPHQDGDGSLSDRRETDIEISISPSGSKIKFQFAVSGEPSCPQNSFVDTVKDDPTKFSSRDKIREIVKAYEETRRTPFGTPLSNGFDRIGACAFVEILAAITRNYADQIREQLGPGRQNVEDIAAEIKRLELARNNASRAHHSTDIARADATIRAEVDPQVAIGYVGSTRLLWQLSSGDLADVRQTAAGANPLPLDAAEKDRVAAEKRFETERRIAEFEANASVYWWISAGIVAIFIFVECAPILAKLLSDMGPYERSIAARGAQVNEETQERLKFKKKARNANNEAEAELEILKAKKMLAGDRVRTEYALAFEDRLAAMLAEQIAKAPDLESVNKAMEEYSALREKFFGPDAPFGSQPASKEAERNVT